MRAPRALLVAQADTDELRAAMQTYQDQVRETLTSWQQRLKAKVLEPSAVKKEFREIKRLGCAERRSRDHRQLPLVSV